MIIIFIIFDFKNQNFFFFFILNCVLCVIVPEIQALLLSDLLVLLQKGPDERLILRCPSRSLGGVGGGATDLKTPFCPIVRLDSSLVRSVATGESSKPCIYTCTYRHIQH